MNMCQTSKNSLSTIRVVPVLCLFFLFSSLVLFTLFFILIFFVILVAAYLSFPLIQPMMIMIPSGSIPLC
ncbi:hypothetical protein BDV37DRAFT_259657 [Aspergillus pseudonomiae]|uniref:Uncharacterized protein n=1 Tax=Aspergillus pseudonomiae TaxID=1506151 RepID=A0A5N7D1N7_9EURO|nr:uncharacterized protein BDV37DRAFT_259657 [Aspergillus pseudonomiae]KAE8399763.1 hypothetical protein BDV37DRAFT_259657 [Aspergillus pseudonomiae]